MAITAVPYGQFINDLGNGDQTMRTDDHFAMLLTGDYTPNTNTDTYASVTPFEVPNDADADGYKTGGQAVPISGQTWDGITRKYVLLGATITWAKLTGSVRYIAIRNDDNKLCGLIDLGAATAYTAQPFQVSFPDGLFVVIGV